MQGFKFNNKHSYNDFKLILENKKILPPSKKKIKESVPFMNGSYDFSTVGSNGEIVFNERQIDISFAVVGKSKEQIYAFYTDVLEWLADTGKQQLIFDDIVDYYFIAEVEGVTDFEEVIRFGKFKVSFIVEPFKIGVDYEGIKLWDSFNFESDALQDTEFSIVGSRAINIVNVGRIVCPVINVNSNMTIIFNSKTYSLTTGDNKFYDFKLANGSNSITINGTGTVKFIYRKEVI